MIYKGTNYEWLHVTKSGEVVNLKTLKTYKAHIHPQGYKNIVISCGGRDKKVLFKVHRLVAENYIPNPQNKPQVNHIDGDKLNNNVSNLEWCTPKENVHHAYRHGLVYIRKGVEITKAKLDNESVRIIREIYVPHDKKFGVEALSIKFGVHRATIRSIVIGETWKHVV